MSQSQKARSRVVFRTRKTNPCAIGESFDCKGKLRCVFFVKLRVLTKRNRRISVFSQSTVFTRDLRGLRGRVGLVRLSSPAPPVSIISVFELTRPTHERRVLTAEL